MTTFRIRTTTLLVIALLLGACSPSTKSPLLQVVAENLARYDPSDYSWSIDWAYATRRAESIKAAKAILLNAVKRFPKEALIHYKLACYECQLRDIELAKRHLKSAFELRPECRAMALDDPDLKPLWESVAELR